MTDIDRLYHMIRNRWSIRRTQVDATTEELLFLLELLDMMDNDEFGKDNNVPCSGWISVKDKLPAEDGLYNVYCKDGSMAHAWFEEKWFIDHCECGDGYVTHWMPLPEPPKEGALG